MVALVKNVPLADGLFVDAEPADAYAITKYEQLTTINKMKLNFMNAYMRICRFNIFKTNYIKSYFKVHNMSEIIEIKAEGCIVLEYIQKYGLNFLDAKMIGKSCLKDWQDYLRREYPNADIGVRMEIVKNAEVARMAIVSAMEVNEGGVLFSADIEGLEEALQDRLNKLVRKYLITKQ